MPFFAEAAPQPSAGQLLALLEQSPLPKLLMTPELSLSWANAAWLALFGGEPGLRSRRELMHPEDVERLEALFAQLQTGQITSFRAEARLRGSGGVWHKYDSAVSGLYDEQGALSGLLEELRVSDKLRPLQAEQRRLDERLANLEAIAHLGFWELSLPDLSLQLSAGCYRILARSPETAPGNEALLREVLHPEDRERLQAAFEQARASGASDQLHFRVLRPDGEVRYLLGFGRMHAGPDIAPTLQGYVIDQTSEHEQAELLKATHRLLAAQKARLGELAGSVTASLEGPLVYLEALALLAAEPPAGTSPGEQGAGAGPDALPKDDSLSDTQTARPSRSSVRAQGSDRPASLAGEREPEHPGNEFGEDRP